MLGFFDIYALISRYLKCYGDFMSIEIRDQLQRLVIHLIFTLARVVIFAYWSGSCQYGDYCRFYSCESRCSSGIFAYSITETSHERHGFSNHKQLDYLLNSVFRLTPKKITKLHIIIFCEGTGGFPPQRARYVRTFKVSLDISGSPIDFQWVSWKYPGYT